jgi:DNA-binding transcriptional MerR regulator
MDQREPSVNLSELADQPIYNVKAVCIRTGIAGATLRAWERRYGLPSPNRSAHGYRLYSERDVAILRWLINETNRGVNIGNAVQRMTELLQRGDDLNITQPLPTTQEATAPRSPETIAAELADAYSTLLEHRCDVLINEALALYTLETTLFGILQRALSLVREEIQRRESAPTIENFAVNHLRHRLERMLQLTPLRQANRHVRLIGFTNDASELDLLMLTILLRRAGHQAIYVTADFDAELLHSEVRVMQAQLILFYVNYPAHADKLVTFATETETALLPPMLYAGRLLTYKPALHDALPIIYIGDELRLIYHELLVRLQRAGTREQV